MSLWAEWALAKPPNLCSLPAKIMSQLKSFLDAPPPGSAVRGATGQESGWLRLGELAVTGDLVLVCDRDFLPSKDDGLAVKLAPDTYVVEARVQVYPGDRRISRLRLVAAGCTPTPGESLGETWTDTAVTAICDLKTFQQVWERLGEDVSRSRLETARESLNDCGVFSLEAGTGAVAPWVTSGFGDGIFPVTAQVEAGRRVGFEVEFIPPGEPYPFGANTSSPTAAQPAESSSRSDAFAAMAGLLKEAQSRQTGDREKDRAALKATFDQFLGGLQAQAESATAEFHQHVVRLRRKAPAFRAEFFPTTDEHWTRQPAVQERAATLARAGFTSLGVIGVKAVPNYVMSGFVHREQSATATICRGERGTVLTLGANYADGSSFSLWDTATKPGFSRPDWSVVESRPGLGADELIREFFASRPARPVNQVCTMEDFLASAEEEFARIQHWRAERGGWTLAELKAQKGLDASSDTTEALQSARFDSAETWLFNWLRMQEGLPFSVEAGLERLVIIHDELTPGWLVNAWWVATSQFKTKEREFAEGGARAAFARVNEQHGSPLRLVWRKTSGLAADYYLA